MNHEPSLSDVVDVLTARMEATTDPDEREACRQALERIEAYVFRQVTLIDLIARALWKITRRPAA